MTLNNNKGASILQVMFLTVMVLGATIYFIGSRENVDRSVAKNQYNSQLKLVVNQVDVFLSDSKRCIETFKDTSTPQSIVSKVNVDDSTTPETVSVAERKFPVLSDENNQGIGDLKLLILEYELSETDDPSKATFFIRFKNKKVLQGKNGPDSIVRKINMYVERNGSDLVTCRTISSADDELWFKGTGTIIYYDQNVGIGVEEADAKLDVEDDILSTGLAFSDDFRYLSDKSLKSNITKIDSPLAMTLNLNGVNFNWNESKKLDYGFIAQQVQATLPEITKKNRDILSVDYAKLIPILVEAFKKQQNEIQRLKEKLQTLRR